MKRQRLLPYANSQVHGNTNTIYNNNNHTVWYELDDQPNNVRLCSTSPQSQQNLSSIPSLIIQQGQKAQTKRKNLSRSSSECTVNILNMILLLYLQRIYTYIILFRMVIWNKQCLYYLVLGNRLMACQKFP